MFTKMVDMAHTPEDIKKEAEAYGVVPSGNANKYPYGLCISLGNDELEKLNLDCDCEAGDMIHLFAMAKVTSVSQRDTENGEVQKRLELQITHLGLENEEEENEEVEEAEEKASLYIKPSFSGLGKKLYKNEGSY